MIPFADNMTDTKFYGFDSFQGFGELKEEDLHTFYQDDNFKTELDFVERRCAKAAKKLQYQLVPGFFEQSLADGAAAMGIDAARIIFIDSDTFISADQAFRFL